MVIFGDGPDCVKTVAAAMVGSFLFYHENKVKTAGEDTLKDLLCNKDSVACQESCVTFFVLPPRITHQLDSKFFASKDVLSTAVADLARWETYGIVQEHGAVAKVKQLVCSLLHFFCLFFRLPEMRVA